ncbi:putative transmembrane ascorbate ferrireductase 4 [Quercus suber]|uniref:Transmembrane ascorbate ferrireductase 4 n=1 Tax=Quercus suber TaxID=58331 RepID=A0AAW0K284_QUESU
MAITSSSLFPLLFFARLSGLAVALLVLFWALAFKSSFLIHSSQEDLIYAVLHPLLMVIGFILISGEAILVHRWLPGSKSFKKSVHLCLQGVALASGFLGFGQSFVGMMGLWLTSIVCILGWWLMGFLSFWHRGEARTVRLRVLPWHIFLGLYTYGLAVATAETGLLEKLTFLQTKRNVSTHSPESMWLMGFLSFWHRGEARTVRLRVLPWHIFLGLYTYGLAVATAETGLLEKLTFLQTKRNVSTHSPESMVVNSLGLGLALLSGTVILAVVSPKHQTLQNKLMFSDANCLSF